MVAHRKSASNATQKLPLIIGAFVGCSLLMGLLLYSVSGAHAPSPLAKSNSANAPTVAQEKEENAAQPLEGKRGGESVPVKAKADSGKTGRSSNR